MHSNGRASLRNRMCEPDVAPFLTNNTKSCFEQDTKQSFRREDRDDTHTFANSLDGTRDFVFARLKVSPTRHSTQSSMASFAIFFAWAMFFPQVITP